MELDEGVATGRLTELAAARARSEARETEAMIAYRDAELDRIGRLERPLQRQLERAAIALDIATATGMSEARARGRLAMADRLRQATPQVWLAFRDGRLDLERVRAIGTTVAILQRDESLVRLDQSVVAYAESHTPTELNRWLRRFVERVETDLALERAERAREDRFVDVRHGDDGMGTMLTGLPAPHLAAIMKRLDREARAFGPDDPRTLAQRKADLVASWLTTNEAGEPAVHADIAVKLDAQTFTGGRDGFAQASDGSWSCPASWVLDPHLVSNPVWHRIIVDPITDDALAHQYVGRFAPDHLKTAIAFRDGVCQAPGCLVPADRCDYDHRVPWPNGPTNAQNMWPLCRRHHTLKGHQILRWVLPSGQSVDAEPVGREPP